MWEGGSTIRPSCLCTVKKGHAINFSSEAIHLLLLKIQQVSNIS
jgi:hypothetical protein